MGGRAPVEEGRGGGRPVRPAPQGCGVHLRHRLHLGAQGETAVDVHEYGVVVRAFVHLIMVILP